MALLDVVGSDGLLLRSVATGATDVAVLAILHLSCVGAEPNAPELRTRVTESPLPEIQCYSLPYGGLGFLSHLLISVSLVIYTMVRCRMNGNSLQSGMFNLGSVSARSKCRIDVF